VMDQIILAWVALPLVYLRYRNDKLESKPAYADNPIPALNEYGR